ncbi:D-beta-hydroxybutyrate dehydrogenase, mitochondrial-like [Glandiceps talaboti]
MAEIRAMLRILSYILFAGCVYITCASLFSLGHGTFGLWSACLCLLSSAVFKVISTDPTKQLDVGRKAVLITGCDSGFGYSLAVHLDSLGFRVFAACLFKGGEGDQNLVKTCSDRLKTLQLDITNQEQVDNALKEVEKYLDGEELWGLVNNAGLLCLAEFELTPMPTIEKIMEVNCTGHMRVTKAFIPMIRHSKGRIVNVGSIAGRVTHGLHSVYSAAKGGMELFNDGLRMEMEQWGVKVSIIDSAGFRTGMFGEKQMDNMVSDIEGSVPSTAKADYGAEYLKSYRTKMMQIATTKTPFILEDLSPVINSMTDALLSTNPRVRYTDGRGPWIMLFVRKCLPTITGDHLIYKKFSPKIVAPAAVKEDKYK